MKDKENKCECGHEKCKECDFCHNTKCVRSNRMPSKACFDTLNFSPTPPESTKTCLNKNCLERTGGRCTAGESEKVCGNCKQPFQGETLCPHKPESEEWETNQIEKNFDYILKLLQDGEISRAEAYHRIIKLVRSLGIIFQHQARAFERQEILEAIDKMSCPHKGVCQGRCEFTEHIFDITSLIHNRSEIKNNGSQPTAE